jgi:hypothetical protein
MCQKHRQLFRRWQEDVLFLHNMDAAEAILVAPGDVKVDPSEAGE